MVFSQSLVAFVRSSNGEGVGISCCVAPGSELETPAVPGANPDRYIIRCGPRSPRLLWSYAVRSEASDGFGLVPLERPASAYPRWKHGEEEREKGDERKGRKEGGRPSPWTRSPPRASFSRRLSCSPNRIMEGKPRRAALVFLVAFLAVAAGSPACPRPSVVDTILGWPDSCWDSDSTLPLDAYQIGVVEVLPYHFLGSLVLFLFYILHISPLLNCSFLIKDSPFGRFFRVIMIIAVLNSIDLACGEPFRIGSKQ